MTPQPIDPLVPSDVDLRNFAFMPLDVLRLRDSDLSTLATGEEFKAAVLLWCTAWHQIPAGSVANDERWLARHSGAGANWKKVRAEALRGFIPCSDGRLYHPVVAEKALEAWLEKLAQRLSGGAGNAKRWGTIFDPLPIHDQMRVAREYLSKLNPSSPSLSKRRTAAIDPAAHRDSHRDSSPESSQDSQQDSRQDRKGQGLDRDWIGLDCKPKPQSQPPSDAASASPAAEAKPKPNSKGKPEPPTRETWSKYSAAYLFRYGVEPVRNEKVNGMMSRFVKRVPITEAPDIAAFFVQSNRGLYVSAKHAVDLLLRDAEGLRTEWATGQHGTDTQARQTDQTSAQGQVWRELIDEVRERERIEAQAKTE